MSTWICKYAIFLFLSLVGLPLVAQVGLGYTIGIDLYQQLENPDDPEIAEDGPLNSPLFNVHIGPKFWAGGENISFSLEGQVSYAPFAFDYSNRKGVGAVSFPLLAQLQFGGLSGFSVDGGFGFALGGGVEYAITDLYLRKEAYDDLNRDLYQIYIGQAAVGFGVSGVSVQLYARYGKSDEGASNLHIGITIDETLTNYERKRPYGQ